MSPTENYDIVIIGAGIQGAGVAQAVAACGYSNLVIEKASQAGTGTSSKSSKLIHGGLRYLESGQFKLVYECLRERKILLKNAPGLVKLIPFYIPVYKKNSRPAWLIKLGLAIYSILSMHAFRQINLRRWFNEDEISTDKISHLFKYYDAQTDDKALTMAVIKSAIKHGSTVSYNSTFKNSEKINNHHLVTFKKEGHNISVSCKCIINCSGPWVIETQKNISPLIYLPEVELIAGTHIIIDRPLKAGVYYIEAKDKRAIFVIPWKEHHTLIGTTEKHYKGKPDDLRPTQEEIDYLLQSYNSYFKQSIKQENIIESFAGLRVLPASTHSAFKRSRDSLIIQTVENPDIITLIGGKLTAYRASSEQILNRVKHLIPCKNKHANTAKISLE